MRTAKKWFCSSAGIIFLITGTAKVESWFGKAQLLQLLDPILKIQFHHLMLVAGMLEIFVAGVCLLSKSKTTVILLVGHAWLGVC